MYVSTSQGFLDSPVGVPLAQGQSGEVIPTGRKRPLPLSYPIVVFPGRVWYLLNLWTTSLSGRSRLSVMSLYPAGSGTGA